MKTRAIVRTAFILIFTAAAMVLNGGDILLPWHPFSTYGFSANSTGTVTAADSIVEKSGLRAGDRIDIKRLRPVDRISVGYMSGAPEGNVVHLPLASGRVVTLRSHQYQRSAADNVTDVVSVIALWVFIVLAAVLVLLRPMPATWAFFIFSFEFCFQGTLLPESLHFPGLLTVALVSDVAFPASAAAFISFALRFPDERLSRTARMLERALMFGIAPLLACWSVASFVHGVFGGSPAPGWQVGLYAFAIGFLNVFGVGILLVRYVTADAAKRNRLRWVVASFAVAFLPIIWVYIVENAAGILPPVWIINVALAWQTLSPIALTYTVLKHRLFDIRFIVSRALVYAILTSVTVGVLALIDWAFGRWLAQSRFALLAELALAVVLGVLLTSAHRQVERLLNDVIFRAQALALQALRRFAQETDLIGDPRDLLGQTYEALHSRLESDYAAIYTARGDTFELATARGENIPARLSNHDFAVLRLRRWHEPFECDEPGHPLRGALLLPMSARGQLVGFVVCGPKLDRTHYLPEEVEALSLLTHRVGSAYALLTLRPLGFDDLTRASITS